MTGLTLAIVLFSAAAYLSVPRRAPTPDTRRIARLHARPSWWARAWAMLFDEMTPNGWRH